MPLLIKSSVSQPDSSWNRSPSPLLFIFFFLFFFLLLLLFFFFSLFSSSTLPLLFACRGPMRIFGPIFVFRRLSPRAVLPFSHLPFLSPWPWFLRRSPHGSFFFSGECKQILWAQRAGIGMSNAPVNVVSSRCFRSNGRTHLIYWIVSVMTRDLEVPLSRSNEYHQNKSEFIICQLNTRHFLLSVLFHPMILVYWIVSLYFGRIFTHVATQILRRVIFNIISEKIITSVKVRVTNFGTFQLVSYPSLP